MSADRLTREGAVQGDVAVNSSIEGDDRFA